MKNMPINQITFLKGSYVEFEGCDTYHVINQDYEEVISIYYNEYMDVFKITEADVELTEQHLNIIYAMVKDFIDNNKEISEDEAYNNYEELCKTASIYGGAY